MSVRLGPPELMRRFLFLLILLCGVSLASAAQTRRVYINATPITPPQIPPQVEARVFWNQSLFVASNDFLVLPFFNTSPYEATAVRVWRNDGTMVGLPGFNFEYIPNPDRLGAAQRRRRGANLPRPSDSFLNNGQIVASDILNIRADKITNRGLLAGDGRSRVKILATDGLADLSFGAVRTGDLPEIGDLAAFTNCVSPSNFFFAGFSFLFFNADPAVTYSYFSSGNSGFVDTNRQPLFLPSLLLTNNVFGGSFALPNPTPPPAQYIQISSLFPGLPATNVTTNTLFGLQSCGQYDAFVHLKTNAVQNPFTGQFTTNRDVSVVFLPTNGYASNVTYGISFPTNQFGTLPPIVEFRASDFDVIEQQDITNIVTFRDDGANIFRGHDCQFDLGDPPNAPYTSDLFYTTAFVTSSVPYTYSVAYAQIGNTNSIYFTNAANNALFFPPLGLAPNASDPTNYNGSVLLKAKNLDLTRARIRGENAVHIQTDNLIGNESAFIDAPFVTFDASTKKNTLVISNLFKPQATRVQATFNSWAASWGVAVTNEFFTNIVITNVVTTDTNGFTMTNFIAVTNVTGSTEFVNYHVLILGTCVDALHPAIVHRLALEARNIVLQDRLAINASIKLTGRSLTFGSNASLMLPRNTSLAFTNIRGFTRFTNEGVLNVPAGAFFGAFQNGFLPRDRRVRNSRLVSYERFVNHNVLNAASVAVRSRYIENLGYPFSTASITATNGPVHLNGTTVIISNAAVVSTSDITIRARDLFPTLSTLSAGSTNGGVLSRQFAPGAINLDIRRNILEGGLPLENDWRSTTGIKFLRRPDPEGDVLGDLMGTRVIVRSGTFAQSVIQWAGFDVGDVPDGFVGNLALGRLVLDGAGGNVFQFKSAEGQSALYVDYLELVNFGTNYSQALSVGENFALYFGDSNVLPEKLEEISEHIHWVEERVGPFSSTNLVYPDGNTYAFNAGVVRARDRDDDHDNVVNGEDCTPIPVEGVDTFGAQCPFAAAAVAKAFSTANIALTIALASGGREVVLKWNAAANSANTVEFTDSLASGAWQSLTNFVNGPVNARVTVKDAAGAPLRVYRVRVDAGNP
jgi:hypothetical protein